MYTPAPGSPSQHRTTPNVIFDVFIANLVWMFSIADYVIRPPPQAFPEPAITIIDNMMRIANPESGSLTRDTLARRSDSPWLILVADADSRVEVQ
jgi:hypothetical protein